MWRKAHAAALRLHDEYGSPRHGNKADPLDELVFIVLSQVTTHHSFNRTYEKLKHEVPRWDDLAGMPLRRLKGLIKDAGLSGQKAPRLKAIVRKLQCDFGRATLAPLRRMSDEEAERYLTSLPGVGTKTAKCVLMYSLGRHVLPVDTHVWRVLTRLGLVDAHLPDARVPAALEAAVSPRDRFGVHVNAIVHGRRLCLPRYPRCEVCFLRKGCAFARSRERRTL